MKVSCSHSSLEGKQTLDNEGNKAGSGRWVLGAKAASKLSIPLLECGKRQQNDYHAKRDAVDDRGLHSDSPLVKEPVGRSRESPENERKNAGQCDHSRKNRRHLERSPGVKQGVENEHHPPISQEQATQCVGFMHRLGMAPVASRLTEQRKSEIEKDGADHDPAQPSDDRIGVATCGECRERHDRAQNNAIYAGALYVANEPPANWTRQRNGRTGERKL
jgi:hypothetical protein